MNSGFRQYKLPINVTLKQGTQIFINDPLFLKEGSELEFIIDDDDTTNCILVSPPGLSLSTAEIIIQFDDEYLCDGLQLIFNNKIKTVKVFDYSNQTKDILLLEHNKEDTNIEQIIDKKLSAILITDLEPSIEEEDIQIKEINVFTDTINPPEGYYFRDIEIQSFTGEEDV